jgi:hypothetical protein
MKIRQAFAAEMYSIPTHYFDINSACQFLDLLGKMKIKDPKTVQLMREQFEEFELVSYLKNRDLILFVSAYNKLKDLKSKKIRNQMTDKLSEEKD